MKKRTLCQGALFNLSMNRARCLFTNQRQLGASEQVVFRIEQLRVTPLDAMALDVVTSPVIFAVARLLQDLPCDPAILKVLRVLDVRNLELVGQLVLVENDFGSLVLFMKKHAEF